MNLLITICGRGGSKGILQKNIRPICGKPLISYSIQHALQFAKETGADTELSTDDDDIAHVAQDAKLPTKYRRPKELANDSAGKLDVIADIMRHAEEKNHKTYDYILDLDITSPLRTMEDLREGFRMMQSNPRARNLFSVSTAEHNPYFDMVEENAEGFFDLVKKPEAQMLARQEGPRVFDLNASFYFYRREFFEQKPHTLILNSLAYIMPHMCFELDDLLQFSLLEYLIEQKKLDFDFQ